MIVMLSAVPFKTYVVSSGNVYTADQYGIIPNVASVADQTSLTAAGCATLSPNPTNLITSMKGVNFNSTSDQLFTTINNGVRFRVNRITVLNASVSMTNAVGGIYTGANKTGTQIVAASQVYSGLTSANVAEDLTPNAPTALLAVGTNLYFSLTTGQGIACTADIYIFGDTYP